MAKNSLGKRPCSICRKWFQPDVRQKERQKTCGRPYCTNELHRRQCEKWNKKNKEYFKNNCLGKKLDKIDEKQPKPAQMSSISSELPIVARQKLFTNCRTKPILPCEIIVKEYSEKDLIIIQYLIHQIKNQLNHRVTGFT